MTHVKNVCRQVAHLPESPISVFSMAHVFASCQRQQTLGTEMPTEEEDNQISNRIVKRPHSILDSPREIPALPHSCNRCAMHSNQHQRLHGKIFFTAGLHLKASIYCGEVVLTRHRDYVSFSSLTILKSKTFNHIFIPG
jgi:hypothetical protein